MTQLSVPQGAGVLDGSTDVAKQGLAQGLCEAVSLVFRLLSLAVTQARRALSAFAGYLSAPGMARVLDPPPGSEQP